MTMSVEGENKAMRTIFVATLATLLLVFLAIAACTEDEPAAGWKRIDPERISKTQDKQRHEAVRAKEALFANLSSKLRSAIRSDGLEAAVGICRAEAPRLAEQIARDRGLRIGRTSFKLRNAENAPPDWAGPSVRRRAEDPRYFQGPAGELGALFPIRLRSSCMRCHGPADKIDPTVRQKIIESYPGDHAVGFSANDLRGWFWIEVPKRSEPPAPDSEKTGAPPSPDPAN
jgi:hypothetical protein